MRPPRPRPCTSAAPPVDRAGSWSRACEQEGDPAGGPLFVGPQPLDPFDGIRGGAAFPEPSASLDVHLAQLRAAARGPAVAHDKLGLPGVASSFGFDDLIEDADGCLFARAVLGGKTIVDAVKDHYNGSGGLTRFNDWFTGR
ncbi:hypothetical protein ACFY1U_48425 [Streptomyces sp. NPDC001351]|uniref:hypothetical protein n=1 Tax=Streptomyces sp. NPDC001351 TaxID=3364564 RepID=UPI0036A9D9CC